MEKFQVDDWSVLYCWTKRYCEQNSLSMKMLFYKLRIPCYSEKTINEYTRPSKKHGSVGEIVRNELKSFMRSPQKDIRLSIDEQLLNWFYLQFPEERLSQLGIVSLKPISESIITSQKPMVLIIMEEGYDNARDDEILDLFKECRALDTIDRPWVITVRRWL
jgi:hypothetical protein